MYMIYCSYACWMRSACGPSCKSSQWYKMIARLYQSNIWLYLRAQSIDILLWNNRGYSNIYLNLSQLCTVWLPIPKTISVRDTLGYLIDSESATSEHLLYHLCQTSHVVNRSRIDRKMRYLLLLCSLCIQLSGKLILFLCVSSHKGERHYPWTIWEFAKGKGDTY